MHEADAKLVERSLSGEKGAYFELVRRHQAAVSLRAFSLTGEKATARDLSQEAFLRGFRTLRNYRGERSFGDWIFEVLRAVHDDWSKKGELSFERLGEEKPDEDPPSPELLRAFRVVAEQLCGLPDDERRTVIRWHQVGRDAREVADALGDTPANIKAYLAGGQKRLRERLEQRLDLTEFDR